jgi:hypothetical protein
MMMRVASIASYVFVGALVLGACAEASPSSSTPRSHASDDATGDEYAAQLGLIRHEWDPNADLRPSDAGLTLDGELLDGCENSPDLIEAFTVLENGHLYCYSGQTDLDVWVIGERLSGHIPTEAEIEEAADRVQR